MALRCVDASVVVAWLVPSYRSESVIDLWLAYSQGDDQFVGPPHLHTEIVSAIRRLAFRGLLSEEEAVDSIDDLVRLGLATHTPPGLYRRAYELAARYQHSKAYDACYLALADLLGCEFYTLDQRLHRAVAEDFPWVRLPG